MSVMPTISLTGQLGSRGMFATVQRKQVPDGSKVEFSATLSLIPAAMIIAALSFLCPYVLLSGLHTAFPTPK